MTPTRFASAALALAISAVTLSGIPAAQAQQRTAAAQRDWSRVVAMTEYGGVRIGNPAARVTLIEHVSFTCPHCAHFAAESKTPLMRDYVRGGRVRLEIRPILRNTVDRAATALVACTGAARYLAAHDMMFAAQSTWLNRAIALGERRHGQWDAAPPAAMLTMINHDIALDGVLSGAGMTRAQADRCLADPARRIALTAADNQARRDGITGTPMFTLNGVLQDVYDWASLKPLLDQALARPRS